jgi:Trypsin-like peptidase domain
MADQERYEKLLARARRAFGGQPVAEAVGKVRQIIGPGRVPAGQEDAAAAMEALRAGQEPTPRQLAALELMMRLMRAAVYSRGGKLDELPPFNAYEPGTVERWNRFRELISTRLHSIGRIDRVGSGTLGEKLGTGFVVAPGLLATNRHVAVALAFGADKLEEGQGVVFFGQEKKTVDTEDPVPILSIVEVHTRLDMALLRIRDPRDRPPLEIETEEVEEGLAVAAIGYPFEDKRSPLFTDAIYQGGYGVKRAAPGEILERSNETIVYHDCSTLGGNSGSPVLSQDTARVVGLHASGFFMYRNEAVAGAKLGEFVSAHA